MTETETERQPIFPMKTEFSYEPGLRDEMSDQENKVLYEQINFFKYFADQLKSFSGTYEDFMISYDQYRNSFKPEHFEAIKNIVSAFERLTADHNQDIEGAIRQLSEIYNQTLPLGDLTSGKGFSSERIKGYNVIYAETVLSLIDSEVSKITAETSGNDKETHRQLALFYKKLQRLPYFREYNGVRNNLEQVSLSPGAIAMDVYPYLRELDQLSLSGSMEEYEDLKRKLAQFIGELRQRLSQDKEVDEKGQTKLTQFNNLLIAKLNKLGRLGLGHVRMKYNGTDTPIIIEKKKASEKKLLIEKGLHEMLVSTDKYIVFMHRTSEGTAEKIAKTGLATGSQLNSTATASDEDVDAAIAIFQMQHRQNEAVVLIRVPRELYSTIDDFLPIERDKLGGKTHVVPPSWIVGYVLRADTKLIHNTHFGDTEYDKVKPEILYYPAGGYGG